MDNRITPLDLYQNKDQWGELQKPYMKTGRLGSEAFEDWFLYLRETALGKGANQGINREKVLQEELYGKLDELFQKAIQPGAQAHESYKEILSRVDIKKKDFMGFRAEIESRVSELSGQGKKGESSDVQLYYLQTIAEMLQAPAIQYEQDSMK